MTGRRWRIARPISGSADCLLGLELTNEVLNVFLKLLLELSNLISEVAGLLLEVLLEVNWCRRLILALVSTLLHDGGEVTLTTTVPCKNVLGVAWDIAEDTLGGEGDEVLLELLRADFGHGVVGVLGRLEGEQVGEETSDVRRSHGSTGDGVDGVLAADPGGLDVETGSEDVVASAEVGEVGTLVGEGAGTNGHGVLGGGGRVVAGV